MNETRQFYEGLAPLYHLIYPDWEQSVQRQARDLDALIREVWGDGTRRVLDVSCGIGTQALGLARLGYDVTMYFVEDRGKPKCRTHVLRSTYYAIGIPRLMDLMNRAGFEDIRRIDGRFFQPVIIGTRKTQQGKRSVRANPRR